jgi:hypothetical protein
VRDKNALRLLLQGIFISDRTICFKRVKRKEKREKRKEKREKRKD